MKPLFALLLLALLTPRGTLAQSVDASSSSSSAAESSVDERASSDGPSDAFVIFSPDWMPIVTLGPRVERLDWTEARNFWLELEGLDEPTLNGLSASLLLPLFATGRDGARVRAALGAGVGVDFAMRKVDATDPRTRNRTTLRFRALQVSAQLGLILRAAPRGRGFLGTVVWMPGMRRSRHTYADAIPIRGFRDDDHKRSAARGRVTLGYVHDHAFVALFLGAARWSGDPDEWFLVREERVLEAGLQLGSGW